MAAVEKYLVRRDDGLVLLFTPPFDHASPDPGYIKGYLPGVRENGGQYTHAAIWSVLAFAALGDGDKAGELFSLLNPINHASTPRRRLPVQSRALRRRRRYLCRTAARRPRRLDVVHRISGVDVSGWHRVDPGLSVCAARGFISILVSRAHGGALKSHSVITRRATKSSSRTPRGCAGCRLLSSMAHRSRAAACISNSPMTAQRTMCALSLGQEIGVGREKSNELNVPRRNEFSKWCTRNAYEHAMMILSGRIYEPSPKLVGMVAPLFRSFPG